MEKLPPTEHSRHTGEDWRDQWDRVQRWFQRLADLEKKHVVLGDADLTYIVLPEHAIEEVDVAYAFFMNCFHLKDWLAQSAQIKPQVEAYMHASESLSACADICHGVKHFQLDRARSDINWRRAVSYSPTGNLPVPLVLVKGRVMHLTSLARLCVDEWRAFLREQNLDATN